MSKFFQKGDYEVGDVLKILHKANDVYGLIGKVIAVMEKPNRVILALKFNNGNTHFFAQRASVELVESYKVKVKFT